VLRRGGKFSEFDLEPKFRNEVAALPAGSMAGATGSAIGTDFVSPVVQSPVGDPSLLVADSEKRLLREALLKSRGNRTQAAKLMGISRRTLHRKLSQWPELDVIDR